MEARIDPSHAGPRSVLRILGPILIVAGLLLIVTGAIKMFSPAANNRPDPSRGFLTGQRSFDEVSREMHRNFDDDSRSSFAGFGTVAAGMLCLGVGVVMTKFGYMGRVARYVAEEIAPVANDTINYMADGTQNAVRTVARSVSAGIVQGMASANGAGAALACPQCGGQNPPDSQFCQQCGSAMSKLCKGCNQVNDRTARFCHHCGKPLG